jgi:hypothetical protein
MIRARRLLKPKWLSRQPNRNPKYSYLQVLNDSYYYEDCAQKKYEDQQSSFRKKSSFRKYVINIDLSNWIK